MVEWHHQHDSMLACAAFEIGSNVIFHVIDFSNLICVHLTCFCFLLSCCSCWPCFFGQLFPLPVTPLPVTSNGRTWNDIHIHLLLRPCLLYSSTPGPSKSIHTHTYNLSAPTNTPRHIFFLLTGIGRSPRRKHWRHELTDASFQCRRCHWSMSQRGPTGETRRKTANHRVNGSPCDPIPSCLTLRFPGPAE